MQCRSVTTGLFISIQFFSLSIMSLSSLNDEIGGIDIYLLDQILKNRFTPSGRILDVGCGSGRNLFWFLKNGFQITAIDQSEKAVNAVRERCSMIEPGFDQGRIVLGQLADMPFQDDAFDGVICNAVLHFASTAEEFKHMMAELSRVLKPGGTLFIRMTSDVGIREKLDKGENGVYLLPDGSYRFLLTKSLLSEVLSANELRTIEPFKTVNVNDLRCMSTLVLTK